MADNLPFGWKKLTANRREFLMQLERIQELEARTGKSMELKTPQYVRKRDIAKLSKIRARDVAKKGKEMPTQQGVVLGNLQNMIDNLNITSLQDFIYSDLSNDKISEHMQKVQEARQSIIKDILEQQIAEDGEAVVAQRLNDRSARRLVELAQNAILPSDEDLALSSMIEFANLIKGTKMSITEAKALENQYRGAYEQTDEVEEI